MTDRRIPFYNMILRCDNIICQEAVLPDGFCFRSFRDGDERAWAVLEHEAGDFSTVEEAEAYFREKYGAEREALEKRCIFVDNRQGETVGTCIAWHDMKGETEIASLHWLVVASDYQGRGLGKALSLKAMEIFSAFHEKPVYIHTQPWSYKAVLLYVNIGFLLQRTDTFSNYVNQYNQAMETLRSVLSDEQYARLVGCSE